MKKIALITDVKGLDGSYSNELLLGKSYVVHGVKRRALYISNIDLLW